MTTEELLAERGKTHGDYDSHARITQAIKGIINGNDGRLSPAQREALDMIAHKIGRILAGDPNYRDHWDDIAGYAMLVSKQLQR